MILYEYIYSKCVNLGSQCAQVTCVSLTIVFGLVSNTDKISTLSFTRLVIRKSLLLRILITSCFSLAHTDVVSGIDLPLYPSGSTFS